MVIRNPNDPGRWKEYSIQINILPVNATYIKLDKNIPEQLIKNKPKQIQRNHVDPVQKIQLSD